MDYSKYQRKSWALQIGEVNQWGSPKPRYVETPYENVPFLKPLGSALRRVFWPLQATCTRTSTSGASVNPQISVSDRSPWGAIQYILGMFLNLSLIVLSF